MKITKRQLRRIIRESRADDEVDRGWQDFHNGLERDPNGSDWYQDGYDEAKENAVKRGHGDTPRAMREASKMKITKRQLRRIIREEKKRLMDECPMGMMDDPMMAEPPPEAQGHDGPDHDDHGHSEGGMPCPIKTAAKMRESGATEDQLMDFVATLIDEFRSGGTTVPEQPLKLSSPEGPAPPGEGDLLSILGL